VFSVGGKEWDRYVGQGSKALGKEYEDRRVKERSDKVVKVFFADFLYISLILPGVNYIESVLHGMKREDQGSCAGRRGGGSAAPVLRVNEPSKAGCEQRGQNLYYSYHYKSLEDSLHVC